MSHLRLSVLIPAAGASTRLGQPKQLVEYQGRTLIRHAVELALSLDPGEVLVVTGANAAKVGSAIRELPVRLLNNPGWHNGMGGSVALGAAAVSVAADGLMILLCDQWRILSGDLQRLADAWQQAPERIVCASANGINMPPVIFPVSCFEELKQLQGSSGARRLLDRNAQRVVPVEMPRAAGDLDTRAQMEDLEA